ncbi:hypothetical protein HZS_5389 [Henneguya salminicola]|nr:hypothetical protein HZS_5389 [Henneguya salminicola]
MDIRNDHVTLFEFYNKNRRPVINSFTPEKRLCYAFKRTSSISLIGNDQNNSQNEYSMYVGIILYP